MATKAITLEPTRVRPSGPDPTWTASATSVTSIAPRPMKNRIESNGSMWELVSVMIAMSSTRATPETAPKTATAPVVEDIPRCSPIV